VKQSKPEEAYESAASALIDAAHTLAEAAGALRDAAAQLPILPKPPGAYFAGRMARAVNENLEAWTRREPEAFGLPRLKTPAEIALAEAERDLALAKRRLAWARDMVSHPAINQQAGKRLIESHGWNVQYCEDRVAYLKTGEWPEHKDTRDAFDMGVSMREWRDRMGLPQPAERPLPDMPR